MKLKEIYSNPNKPVISYEVFPPKEDTDGEKIEALFVELNKLKNYNPSLISVTYGAGGSNQNESVEIIKRIKNNLHITPMPHFTCVSTGEKDIKKYLATLDNLGIENILALRGDIPADGNICRDFRYASELVAYIKKVSSLSIAVAGYPEGHKDAISLKDDVEFLKQKVELGADVIYTQLFFDNSFFFSFVEKCALTGISVPVIPGILPVTGYKQLEKMAQMCKVKIPAKMAETLQKHSEDKDYIKQYGIEYASKQCEELLSNGVKGLHFYTLNKAYSVSGILSNLNIQEKYNENNI